MGLWTDIKATFSVAAKFVQGKGLKNTMLEMNEKMSPGYGEKFFGVEPPKTCGTPPAQPAPRT